MSKDVLVGLDVGTSSVKALFITASGEVINRIESKIETTYRAGGIAEQNAIDYWNAVKEIFLAAGEMRNDVVAIGLSGQTPSVVCVDDVGAPT